MTAICFFFFFVLPSVEEVDHSIRREVCVAYADITITDLTLDGYLPIGA